jgi:hypothetical protein
LKPTLDDVELWGDWGMGGLGMLEYTVFCDGKTQKNFEELAQVANNMGVNGA